MRRALPGTLTALLACTALALAACAGPSGGTGSSASPSDPPDSPPASAPSVPPSGSAAAAPPPATAAAATSLTVEFSADGQTPSATWTLQCDGGAPVGESGAPDPAAACAALAASGASLFAEPAANLMCTQNIAGVQRASVTGTVNGEPVDATFSLTDGCQISRWEQLAGLLGPADGSL